MGDDDQGLYRFRGATIRNILEFPGHFAEGECKQVKLVTNYRSERQIIDFYNKWMSTTDGRAYDFMWKNFRFEKKIVPPEGKKDAKVGVIKCSGKDLLDDWYEEVYSFITQLKSSGVLTDYNQIAVLCKSVKGDKIIGMVEYLEEHGIKVYSPRSEMFFERKEIKQVIGCMILCFPEYVRKLQQRDFSYDFENLYNYYDTQCIAAARELILQYRDTLGKWIAEKMHKHANLRKDNADYAFTGLLYQLLQFEPFSTYLGIDMKSGVIDERPARNLSILSSILGKYEYLHRIGNESVPATPSQLRELVLRGSGESYDSLKSRYDFNNMSFTKLKSVYKQRTGNTFEDTDYESFGLIDEKGNLTNAGALLADESPVRHSRLFCTRWN